MRQGVASWLAKILLGLLIASFAVWGIGDVFRAGGGNVVATIGDVKITAPEFLAEFQRAVNQERVRSNGAFDTQAALRQGLDRTVINRMVARTAFDVNTADMGMRVSDKQVRRAVHSQDAFKDSFGSFDRFRFDQILRQMRLSEKQFLEQVRHDVARDHLITTLLGQTTPPKVMADTLFRFVAERRDTDYVLFESNKQTGLADPDEATLEAYYKAHEARFTAPEYRAISLVVLNADELADKSGIDDARVRKEYDSRMDEFAKPEKRDVEWLLFDSKEAAEAAAKKLQAGTSFEALRKELGEQIGDTILGSMSKSELDDLGTGVGDAVYGLAENVPSTPINTSFGWRIFRVTKIVKGGIKPFEEVREQLRRELARYDAENALYELVNAVEDTLASGASLEELAKKLALPLKKVPQVDVTGLNADGLRPANLPENAEILRYAFNHETGAELELKDTADGGYFILRVDGITPPALKPLDTVRDEVKSAWLAQEREKAAQARANALHEKAMAGEDFAALAKAAGLKIRHLANISRYGAGLRREISAELLSSLFHTPKEGVAVGEDGAGRGFVVARITAIKPGDPAVRAEEYRLYVDSLRNAMASDLVGQYQAALFEKLGIKINTALIASLFQNQ
jgi:peptidyl-prolyl cis-trans isomerase D